MSTKEYEYDHIPDSLPQASGWSLFFCGECPHGHLIFEDENGKPMFEAVVSVATLRKLYQLVRANDPNFHWTTIAHENKKQ